MKTHWGGGGISALDGEWPGSCLRHDPRKWSIKPRRWGVGGGGLLRVWLGRRAKRNSLTHWSWLLPADVTQLCAAVSNQQHIVIISVLIRTATAHTVLCCCLSVHGVSGVAWGAHVLSTQLYLCVLCASENKQRLFPYTALTDWFL